MKTINIIFIILIFVACKNNSDDKQKQYHFFNNVKLDDYVGKRVFYLLDTLHRLNYLSAFQSEYVEDGCTYINGFSLQYSDTVQIFIRFSTFSFIPHKSRKNGYYETDSSWTADNFLKEKIQYVEISGIKNGQSFCFYSGNRYIFREFHQ